jgi:hypothetical protein
MRTKTLLCAAVLAATVATSMAQSNVYSLNVVGYYNVDSPAGQKVLIANQLHTTNDVLSNVLPGPFADGTSFFKYAGGFAASSWDTDANAWTADFSMKPGEGGFFFSQVHQTLTFVGEVPQGSLTNKLVKNAKTIAGSQVPRSIFLSTSGIIGEDGDTVFQYHNGYSASSYDTDAGAWTVDFSNKVGEAWFVFKQGSQTNWVVNFTVQ